MDINFGLKPFWFWNGNMSDDEIRRQINEMADKGIGGFFIHPRQGLTVPYLSEQWFDKVGIAIEEAKKRGLEAWLYDEYPYPSGISGGEVVLAHPEFEAKVLWHKTLDVDETKELEVELPWGEPVMAAAYPLEDGRIVFDKSIDLLPHIGIGRSEHIFQISGLTAYNRKRYFTGHSIKQLRWHVPDGRWRIYIFVQVVVTHFKYFDKFVDPLNPEAVSFFIQTTHEQYKKHFGHEFGRTIKGIFCDEIAPVGGDLPWSPLLPEIFFKRNGYSLLEKLPALFEPIGEETARIRYDYWNTVVEAFINSFDVQVSNWCKDNGLLYVGEKPILRSSQLQHMDIPGIDAGHQKIGEIPAIAGPNYRANAKILSSAAHFYNKSRALCECFHSIGWGMTLQDMKWIFDWLAVQGVNCFVPHAFFYTTDGLTKHDAPPSSFYQMPAWKYMGQLSSYLSKMTSMLSGSSRVINILLLDPITSQWTAMGEKRRLKDKLKRDFSHIQEILLREHLDYYIVDPQLLAKSKVDDGNIEINGERFNVLVLPPMLNIEDEALKKIDDYINSNGVVIAIGCLPVEKIGCIDDVAQRFSCWFGVSANDVHSGYIGERPLDIIGGVISSNNAVFVANIENIASVIEKYVEREISIKTDDKENENVLATSFIKEEGKYCFLTNTCGQKQCVDISLKCDGFLNPILKPVSLDNENILSLLDYHQADGYVHCRLELAPYQSCMLEMGENIEMLPKMTAKRYSLSTTGKWQISVNNMNALRLGKWKLQVQTDDNASNECVVASSVECMPIIDQIADSGIALPVKLKNYFGCPKEIAFPSLFCQYDTSFIVDTDKPLWLVVEPNAISGQWYIYVNEKRISPEDFVHKPIYVPTNLAFDITPMIKRGINDIRVCVHTDHTYDGLVNPIYVCGEFAVYKRQDMWCLCDLPTEGYIGDNTGNGLPFYAGDICYKRMINLEYSDASDEMVIYLDENAYVQDPVTLFINGHNAGTRAWSPYVWYVKKDWLKDRDNEIELCITTTLLGLFEGQRFDSATCRYVDI